VQTRDDGGEHQVDDVVALEKARAERGADGEKATQGGSLRNGELSFRHVIDLVSAGRARDVRPARMVLAINGFFVFVRASLRFVLEPRL